MTTSAEKILQRAKALHITMWVEGDKIKCSGRGTIPPRMIEVIRSRKRELIALLLELETKEQEPDEPELCNACLNEGRERPAHFIGPDEVMYCQQHYHQLPSDLQRAEMERLAALYREALPGWDIHVEPRCTLEEHLKRVQAPKTQADYWTEARAKLRQSGYYEQARRDEQQRLVRPRLYPHPFPAYDMVEGDGGKKTLQEVGMWHPSEPRLMTEAERQAYTACPE